MSNAITRIFAIPSHEYRACARIPCSTNRENIDTSCDAAHNDRYSSWGALPSMAPEFAALLRTGRRTVIVKMCELRAHHAEFPSGGPAELMPRGAINCVTQLPDRAQSHPTICAAIVHKHAAGHEPAKIATMIARRNSRGWTYWDIARSRGSVQLA